MIGESFSFSQRAGIVRLVGGPYDGQSGLYDHNEYDSISFSLSASKCTHEYAPRAIGASWEYVFVRTYYWNAGDAEFESWRVLPQHGGDS